MESNITIDITKFRSLLESKKAKGQNLQPALEKIGMDLEKETQLNFKRKKDPDGMPWKELSPFTKEMKLKKGRNPNNILRDTGLMLNSINNIVGENFAVVAPGKEVTYAKDHQFGAKKKLQTEKGWRTVTIPQRKFIGITEKMKKRYMKIIMDYLKED